MAPFAELIRRFSWQNNYQWPPNGTGWILPQRGPMRTQWYVPDQVDLPGPAIQISGDYQSTTRTPFDSLKMLVFDFGINPSTIVSAVNGNPGLGPREVQEISFPLEENFLIWGITAVNGQSPLDAAGGFSLQIYHTHEGNQRQLYNRALNVPAVGNPSVTGSAKRPELLRRPYLVAMGDVLEVEVTSLSSDATHNTLVQVVLWGRLSPEIQVTQ